jgi:hypothetical protein
MVYQEFTKKIQKLENLRFSDILRNVDAQTTTASVV